MDRRHFLIDFVAVGLFSLLNRQQSVAADPAERQTEGADSQHGLMKQQWMEEWMSELSGRGSESQLHLGRFKDPIYFLLKQITWNPDPPNTRQYKPVEVPAGFVTDLASIPPVFFSLLRPDGEYTYPAIVHDFLYWTQSTSKDVADEIFRLGMAEFDVPATTTRAIYEAVRHGGERAWTENANRRARGEKRILKKFPPNAKISWAEWKMESDVFLDR
jgi:hypothetical protein